MKIEAKQSEARQTTTTDVSKSALQNTTRDFNSEMTQTWVRNLEIFCWPCNGLTKEPRFATIIRANGTIETHLYRALVAHLFVYLDTYILFFIFVRRLCTSLSLSVSPSFMLIFGIFLAFGNIITSLLFFPSCKKEMKLIHEMFALSHLPLALRHLCHEISSEMSAMSLL